MIVIRHVKKPAIIRDRFWLWGHEAGAQNGAWGIPKLSRITPAEAASYMGVPNALMIKDYGPAPRFDQDAVPLSKMKRLVWSMAGGSNKPARKARAAVIELAARMPNITGVIIDDFFQLPGPKGEIGIIPVKELQLIRRLLTAGRRRLDLWLVWYDHQLALPVKDHIKFCDKISFWTWEAHNLVNLEANFAQVEQLAPKQGKVLGCYMWDYGQKRPMPLDLMEMQCETGLRWLKDGRIEGMIFLASCICDLELEAVEWTRQWIARTGDLTLE